MKLVRWVGICAGVVQGLCLAVLEVVDQALALLIYSGFNILLVLLHHLDVACTALLGSEQCSDEAQKYKDTVPPPVPSGSVACPSPLCATAVQSCTDSGHSGGSHGEDSVNSIGSQRDEHADGGRLPSPSSTGLRERSTCAQHAPEQGTAVPLAQVTDDQQAMHKGGKLQVVQGGSVGHIVQDALRDAAQVLAKPVAGTNSKHSSAAWQDQLAMLRKAMHLHLG